MPSLKELIRDIPDFPKKGILFKDITPVLQNPKAFQKLIDWYKLSIESAGGCDTIAGIESRGFILGGAVAYSLGVGFVPLRKEGKLPYKKLRIEYSLEYAEATLEIHIDAIEKGQKVAIIDDLLATGGTASSACDLIQQLGGEISCVCFFIELDFLKGREKLQKKVEPYKIFSLLHF